MNEEEIIEKWFRELLLMCRIWGVVLLALAAVVIVAGIVVLATGHTGEGVALMILGGFLGLIGLANAIFARMLGKGDRHGSANP